MFGKHLLPAILWAFVILILTGMPGNYIPHVSSPLKWLKADKIVHMVMFGTFAFLLFRGFSKQYTFSYLRYNYLLAGLIVGMVFGIITEILQYYVFIGRDGNIFDFLADLLGCLIGMTVFLIFFRKNSGALKNN
jgi:VanZ family protein